MIAQGIKLSVLTVLFSATCSLSLRAEKVLSLKFVQEKALSSNLTLKAAREELRIFEGRIRQAGAIPNPGIEGTVAEIPFDGGNEATKEVGVEQSIPLLGKRFLRRKSAVSDLEAARARYRSLELDILSQAKRIYWDLSLADDRVNFAKENLKFQQRFLSRVQDRFQSGQAKLADVARAKVEEARASNELLIAQKIVRDAQARLNRLMGQDVRQELANSEHLSESVISLDENTLMQEAIKNRPEIAATSSLQEGAQSELQLANRLLWAPDLRTGFFYQKGEREDGRESWGAKLGLAFPLWYRYGGERLSASARVKSLDLTKQDLTQAISLEVHQAYLELNLSAEQIKLWKQAVDQATEAARLAEQQYLEGDVDILVFVQARRDLVSATLDYLNALRNYRVNLASLERAIGGNLLEVK